MNRTALLTFLLLSAFAVFTAGPAYAQEADPALEPYVPPPMFGPGSAAAPADNIISFPVKTESRSSDVNPGTAPSPQVTPTADVQPNPAVNPSLNPAQPVAEAAPAPKRRARPVPPVPPMRPAVLQASEPYLAQQKKLQEEAVAKKLAEEEAAKKAQDELLAEQKSAAEAQARAEIAAEKQAEPETVAPAQVEVKTLPEEAEAAPPEPPAVTEAPKAPMEKTLLGAPLAEPSVQEIYENLEENHPIPLKTITEQGPVNPFERMVSVRSNTNAQSIRIYAKRPIKKKEVLHSYFLMFQPDQTEITEVGKANLEKKILPVLTAHPELKIQVQAYAKANPEDAGSAQPLSLARAAAIRAFFLEKNISPTRIQTHALGAEGAAGPQDRVDIILQREIIPGKTPAQPTQVPPAPVPAGPVKPPG